MTVTLALGLLACGTDEPTGTSSATSAPTDPGITDPAPWTYTGETSDPPVDVDAVADALQVGIDGVLDYDAGPIVEPYLEAYATSSTLTCPGAVDDGLGNLYWTNSCNADDGTYFGGYLSHFNYVDLYDPYSALTLNGTVLAGNITVVRADGSSLDLEGSAQLLTGVSSDGLISVVASALIGGFGYDGADATGWARDGREAMDAYLTAYTIPIVNGVAVIVDAAINPVIDGQTWSVDFPASTVGNAPIGSQCDLEPGGFVSVRDPYGRWIDIEFHGPILDVDEGDPSRCDGCGDATLDGDDLGEVCADFSSWYAWELLP